MTDYKRDVLEEYALEQIEYLKEQGAEYFNQLLEDQEIHFKVFNEDYYIVYHSNAIEWMGSHSWECIARVQEYENENFGEVTTDMGSPESIVNMYAYVVGEEIIQELDLQPMEEEEEEEEPEEVEPEEVEPVKKSETVLLEGKEAEEYILKRFGEVTPEDLKKIYGEEQESAGGVS